jgi:DNA-binding MarR family transcriptional regulator
MGSNEQLPFDPIAEARRQWVTHGWEASAAGMAAVTSVVRAHQLLVSRVDKVLAPYQLTFSRFEVLMLLSFTRRASMAMGRMSTRLQVAPGSVTNAVARLERQGLVTRTAHPTDGRATLAEITPEGRRLAFEAAAEVNAAVFSSLGLDGAELAELFRLLGKLRRQAGDIV